MHASLLTAACKICVKWRVRAGRSRAQSWHCWSGKGAGRGIEPSWPTGRGERSAASPQGPGTGKGITSLMSALTLEGWGKTKEMILLYSNSSILTVPRPNSGWLRLALGDFGLWLQLKSDLKVELRLENTQRCTSVFGVFRRELLKIWTEEPGSGRGNFIFCLTLRAGPQGGPNSPARLHFPAAAGFPRLAGCTCWLTGKKTCSEKQVKYVILSSCILV